MSWFLLLLAGLLEIAWAVGLKHTAGFTRFWPTLGTVLAFVCSVVLLGLAMRTLPLGTTYATWTAIGAVGTVILGMLFFGDPVSVSRLACVALIVIGVAGLKLTG